MEALVVLGARFLTDACLLLLGVWMIWVALRLWATHPVNRVFGLGPYVTEEGLRLLLQHWLMVFALGLTLLAQALSRFCFKLHQLGHIDILLVEAIGLVEAGFTLWSTILAVRALCAIRWPPKKT